MLFTQLLFLLPVIYNAEQYSSLLMVHKLILQLNAHHGLYLHVV